MATKIRLTRLGRKKVPYYHIVVADSNAPRDGKFIEKVGTYNPLVDNEKQVSLNKERLEYWLSVGAIPTTRVAIILNKNNIKGAEKYKPVFVPKQKQVKQEEIKEESKVEETTAEAVDNTETPKSEA